MSATNLSPAAPDTTGHRPPLVVTLQDVAAATGARIVQGDPQTPLGALDIDSRRLTPGDWFLAHQGSTADGHDFLGVAREAGIAGAVVTRANRLPADWDLPTLAVEDHAAFLDTLGSLIRTRFKGPVVGITGSVGKTTCKHVLSHLLAHDRVVLATPWNWNTEIGVPLTLTRLLKSGADVCVLELAMRGEGQIAQL
ncbi:MAG: Mur ligase family protein, partial [bacterium]